MNLTLLNAAYLHQDSMSPHGKFYAVYRIADDQGQEWVLTNWGAEDENGVLNWDMNRGQWSFLGTWHKPGSAAAFIRQVDAKLSKGYTKQNFLVGSNGVPPVLEKKVEDQIKRQIPLRVKLGEPVPAFTEPKASPPAPTQLSRVQRVAAEAHEAISKNDIALAIERVKVLEGSASALRGELEEMDENITQIKRRLKAALA